MNFAHGTKVVNGIIMCRVGLIIFEQLLKQVFLK